MKIRNGFVSNSSSSSFIVALSESEPCRYCGRHDTNILDLIESASAYNDDNRVIWTDPTEFLEELQQEVYNNQLDLEKWVDKDHDEDVTYTYNGGKYYTYKVGKLRKWAQDIIDRNTQLINDIQNKISEGKKIVSFLISYHDSTLNNLVQTQIHTGTIEVIEGENE
jgi:hypothetical protein